jgi:hypothetical protein
MAGSVERIMVEDAETPCLLLDGLEILLLPHVQDAADDVHPILLLDPLQHHGSVQAAGIGQNDLLLRHFMISPFFECGSKDRTKLYTL